MSSSSSSSRPRKKPKASHESASADSKDDAASVAKEADEFEAALTKANDDEVRGTAIMELLEEMDEEEMVEAESLALEMPEEVATTPTTAAANDLSSSPTPTSPADSSRPLPTASKKSVLPSYLGNLVETKSRPDLVGISKDVKVIHADDVYVSGCQEAGKLRGLPGPAVHVTRLVVVLDGKSAEESAALLRGLAPPELLQLGCFTAFGFGVSGHSRQSCSDLEIMPRSLRAIFKTELETGEGVPVYAKPLLGADVELKRHGIHVEKARVKQTNWTHPSHHVDGFDAPQVMAYPVFPSSDPAQSVFVGHQDGKHARFYLDTPGIHLIILTSPGITPHMEPQVALHTGPMFVFRNPLFKHAEGPLLERELVDMAKTCVQVSLVTGSHVKYIGPVSQDKDQDYSVVPTQLAHLELIEQRLNSPEDLEACVTGRVVSVARYKARLLDAFQQWFRKLKTLIPDKSVASTITRVDQLCDVLGNVQLQPEIVSRWKKRTGNGRVRKNLENDLESILAGRKTTSERAVETRNNNNMVRRALGMPTSHDRHAFALMSRRPLPLYVAEYEISSRTFTVARPLPVFHRQTGLYVYKNSKEKGVGAIQAEATKLKRAYSLVDFDRNFVNVRASDLSSEIALEAFANLVGPSRDSTATGITNPLLHLANMLHICILPPNMTKPAEFVKAAIKLSVERDAKEQVQKQA